MTQPAKPRGNTSQARRWAARVLKGAKTCALCGQPLDHTIKWPDPMSPSADHIESWENAPHLRYKVSNGQPTHLICNQKRGRRTMEELAPPPSRDW